MDGYQIVVREVEGSSLGRASFAMVFTLGSDFLVFSDEDLHLLFHGLVGGVNEYTSLFKEVGDSPSDCGLPSLSLSRTFHFQGFEVGSEMD